MPRFRSPSKLVVIAGISLVAIAESGCELEMCLDVPDESAKATAQAPAAIIGGEVDDENRSTVALLLTNPDETRSICSGTVVATKEGRGYVLTAAHCVGGTVDFVLEATDWNDCTPAGDESKCGAVYVPTSVVAHPEYVPETFENDYAIVTFEGATPSTSVTPIAGGSDGLLEAGSITLSGFGRTYTGKDDPDVFQTERHRVETQIAALEDEWIRIDGTTGKTACFGDSGGPAYAIVEGVRRVVGVASNADERCEKGSNYSRISHAYASFIAQNLPEPCNDCGQGGSSSTGTGTPGSTSASSGATGSGSGAGSSEGGAAPDPDEDDDAGSAKTAYRDYECQPRTLRCSSASDSGPASPANQAALAMAAIGLATLMRRRLARARRKTA